MKALIVDESLRSRQVLRNRIASWDWETLEASNNGAALSIVRHHRPDLILFGARYPSHLLHKLTEDSALGGHPLVLQETSLRPVLSAGTHHGAGEAPLPEAVTAASLRFLQTGSINEMARILL